MPALDMALPYLVSGRQSGHYNLSEPAIEEGARRLGEAVRVMAERSL
jgi:hypothetical protein